MWKVKRMNTARILVLTNALGAGGIAASLVSGSDSSPTGPLAQLQAVDVLAAESGHGRTVTPEDMQRQTWPAATTTSIFRRSERLDATIQIAGSIARAAFELKPEHAKTLRSGISSPTAIQK